MENPSVNRNPQVSVIMPSYNTSRLISTALDSVLQQVFRDFEVIVVNDGSPDTEELEKVLQPYLSKIVYVKQPNKRAGGARNTAIAKARGEFLAFLDSDDSWLPQHLASQMQMFKDDPSLDLVYSNCVLASDLGDSGEFMRLCPSEGTANFAALVVERCHIPISSVVVRKRIFEKAGTFDETLARCDDYDMWLRAAFHGAKIGYSKKVQARLSTGRPGSLGTSRARMTEAYWKILQKADESLPLSPEDRDTVRKRAAEVHGMYLLEEGKLRLREGRFDEARKLLLEANSYLRRTKLTLVLLGLSIAPATTSKFASLVERNRA
jgi:glycosyltransferase involved in cell wall biosynthesis